MDGASPQPEANGSTARKRTPWQPPNPLETAPADATNRPDGRLPNTPLMMSCIAFCLGSVFAMGSLVFVIGGVPGSLCADYRLGFFAASWAFFHFAEFAVTAGWNRPKVSVDSFLLNNGIAYHLANGIAVTEFLVTQYFFPNFKTYPFVSQVGIIVTLVSHALRSGAMIHAATSFSHAVMFKKEETHVLVTDGIYAWLRHPSYTGFFYWGLGTQLTLQNPISFVGYFVVMWNFFHQRIPIEERQLVKFFGDDYINYRKRVGTLIPFIP
ncbi:hypothetical protein FRC04_001927 [Tulasnella sp. 424]|nr:hypothetical protein FRC04_001927 [Tulasnella sp. 424]